MLNNQLKNFEEWSLDSRHFALFIHAKYNEEQKLGRPKRPKKEMLQKQRQPTQNIPRGH